MRGKNRGRKKKQKEEERTERQRDGERERERERDPGDTRAVLFLLDFRARVGAKGRTTLLVLSYLLLL